MTELHSFSSALAEQIRSDARGVVVPPVTALRARVRRRQATRVAGAALTALAMAGAGALGRTTCRGGRSRA